MKIVILTLMGLFSLFIFLFAFAQLIMEEQEAFKENKNVPNDEKYEEFRKKAAKIFVMSLVFSVIQIFIWITVGKFIYE